MGLTLSAIFGYLNRACHRGRRLFGDRRGAVAVFVAFAIVPLIGFVGIGTDSARAFMVKSRLSSAVDAAGLAGGRAFFADTRDEDIVMFFNANFPAGYMGATVNGPNFTVDETAETIEVSAAATVPTAFMRLFGFENITVSATAEITRQMEMLDVVLAIDMSGSMTSSSGSGTSRITAARDAANILVDILFGNEGTKDLLQIGLVPWNGKVNITLNGSIFDDTLTVTQAITGFTNPETGVAQNEVYYVNNSPVPLLTPPP
ncbi:MAG: pilus assembly protein, partial [Rhodospirillales bacterium]|nr:pilus assembly protein [Rhodospirillales bacterium]